MRILRDTHMLIWEAAGRLPKEAERLLVNDSNTLYFSPVSIWEISIKKSLGKNDFKVNPEVLRRGLLDNQYQELPITSLHALAVNDLPPNITKTRLAECFWRKQKLKIYHF